MGTWNLAGLAEDDIDEFINELSDNYAWDFVCLQETFSRSSDVSFDSNCALYTAETVEGGLKCPAILVNEKWKSNARMLGSGVRWVAVEVDVDVVIVSLHLPHLGLSFAEFLSCLESLDTFLDTCTSKSLIFGMDANTRVCLFTDHSHVGDGVPFCDMDEEETKRCELLMEFLCKHDIYLANTFADSVFDKLHTRHNWGGGGGKQIDFIGLPLNLECSDTGVDQILSFRTDHRYVWTTIVKQLAAPSADRIRAPRNWKPSESWPESSAQICWNFESWEDMATTWREAALAHSLRQRREKDNVLLDLLQERALASPVQQRMINKRIWRHRRAQRRLRAKKQVQQAAHTGSFPKQRPKNSIINCYKIFGDAKPQEALHSYFLDIYSLDEHELAHEQGTKDTLIGTWQSSHGIAPFHVTVERLRKGIERLKNGKGSPDGCSAEMFKHLPDVALQKMSAFYTALFASLVIPTCWTVVIALLIPKVIGATSLSKFRAIACLPTARKLLGYLWMQTLPNLRYESMQCGFVPGSHAANGVYSIGRAIELSKEWGKTLFIAQLDLTKAFDKVLHSGVINALKLQGASLQCTAILCALLKQSKASVNLGNIQAPPIDMHRGLPQGAPESPLLFTLVTELILRPLLRKWRAGGHGWSFDEFFIAVICYADDVLIVSHDLQSLEKMLVDIIEGFASVGLEVSPEKCHWTSYPANPRKLLKIGRQHLQWEASLIFIGTVLNACGNDGLAITYRMAQATKVFFKWRQILQCIGASLKHRAALFVRVVFAALLWLSETWHPTAQQCNRLNSWGARMMSKVVRVRRLPDECPGDHWKRLHRSGHIWLARNGGGADTWRRLRLHGFAGHTARATEGLACQALRTRPLAWWRFMQRCGRKHPQRFHAWRWEQQLTDAYGEAESPFVDESVGWMALATSRRAWRSLADAFSKRA